MKKIVVRVDSSHLIGSGHLIRCINLCKKLEDSEITFICRNLKGNFNSKVIEAGYKLLTIGLEQEDYLPGTNIQELKEVEPVLSNLGAKTIIVDHYGLSEYWEEQASKYCSKLLVIDDLDRIHNSHAILDQNFRIKPTINYQNSHSKLFMGCEYSILNDNFTHTSFVRDNNEVKNILCFFGGSDSNQQTLRLAKIFSRSPLVSWHFVIGAQYRNADNLRKVIEQTTHFNLYQDINYMHKLIKSSDLFVGAGGSTTWERAFFGLPSIVMSVAKNQEDINQQLDDKNIINYLGIFDKISDDLIQESVLKMIKNTQMRKNLSDKSLSLNVGSKLPELINYLES